MGRLSETLKSSVRQCRPLSTHLQNDKPVVGAEIHGTPVEVTETWEDVFSACLPAVSSLINNPT